MVNCTAYRCRTTRYPVLWFLAAVVYTNHLALRTPCSCSAPPNPDPMGPRLVDDRLMTDHPAGPLHTLRWACNRCTCGVATREDPAEGTLSPTKQRKRKRSPADQQPMRAGQLPRSRQQLGQQPARTRARGGTAAAVQPSTNATSTASDMSCRRAAKRVFWQQPDDGRPTRLLYSRCTLREHRARGFKLVAFAMHQYNSGHTQGAV